MPICHFKKMIKYIVKLKATLLVGLVFQNNVYITVTLPIFYPEAL